MSGAQKNKPMSRSSEQEIGLIIVESPAKAKTLKKFLGKNFQVLASYGHVRDLLPKEGAVEPDNQFAMHYQLIEKNEAHVKAIVAAVKKAGALYLAPDPDREGEAIAWHIYEILKEKKALSKKPIHRVVFHEITKRAILEAIEHPRELSMDYVNAQQARRALDYLVGFNLSPLLWRKVRRGLSAGRVQSPALRLIVEREQEIEKFEPQEFWTIAATAETQSQQSLLPKLIEYQNEKLSQFSITTAEVADKIRGDLLKQAQGKMTVTKVEKKQRQRNPAAPFTTSTLQQEAIRKLGFTAQYTMRTAQQLYEGIDTGEGAVGLITYMRTDSVHLAQEAIEEVRGYIKEYFGKENLPEKARVYKTRAKNAQEAHEAIRPTSVYRTPESIKQALTPQQFKLYSLIWKRTVASQMIHATMNTVAIDLQCGQADRFRATGSVIANPGFIAVYQETSDDKKTEDDDEKMLPHLEEGDVLQLLDIQNEQHFTEPPPRYTEASLVKALEELGIGRPSTYASIISTLQHREYVELDQKRFKPTDVGRIVNRFLTEYFTQYVDYDFTAKLEDELDAVSRGEKGWIPLLDAFWSPFHARVEEVNATVNRKDVTHEALDESCPQCGKKLDIRLGKRGRFIGCTGYPDCDYTRNLNESADEAAAAPDVIEGRKCPECNSDLILRQGRYGKFIGCSNYPKCKHIEPLVKPKDTKVECPECHQATLLERKSRYGKLFYSCARYPDCKYATWNPPLAEPCPKCHWPILTIKTTKRRGTEKVCPQKTCGFTEAYLPDESDET